VAYEKGETYLKLRFTLYVKDMEFVFKDQDFRLPLSISQTAVWGYK
jgi:hypothetical protein